MPRHVGFLLPLVPLRPIRELLLRKPQPQVMTALASRRAFLSLATSATLLGAPWASHALSRDEAAREARLAYASLPMLYSLVDLGDYNGFRMQLRTGAMSRVRASCSAWYRSFEKTDERAVRGAQLYRGLIKAVEAADLAALKAERGGDVGVVPELARSIGLRFDEFIGAVGE